MQPLTTAIASVPAICFAIVAGIILTDVMGKDWIFGLHPLMMSAGFILCFSYGIISYRLDAFNAKLDVLSIARPMSTLRIHHRNWQFAGSLAATAGLIAIMASKITKGKNLYATPSLHATVGFLTLIGVAVQGVAGYLKMRALDDGGQKVHTWHGYLGYATYAAGALSIALGAAEYWPADTPAPFAVAAAAAAAAAVAAALRLALPPAAAGAEYAQVSE